MFLRDKIAKNREKLIAEGMAKGRAEGRAARDAEWIEWAANGKDPDTMPSKVNPVTTDADKVETQKS